jgi:hypothetical protein
MVGLTPKQPVSKLKPQRTPTLRSQRWIARMVGKFFTCLNLLGAQKNAPQGGVMSKCQKNQQLAMQVVV